MQKELSFHQFEQQKTFLQLRLQKVKERDNSIQRSQSDPVNSEKIASQLKIQIEEDIEQELFEDRSSSIACSPLNRLKLKRQSIHFSPSKLNKQIKFKRNNDKWQQDESDFLKEMVEKYQNRWKKIASKINEKFHEGKSLRTPRNCRERFKNHENPVLSSKCLYRKLMTSLGRFSAFTSLIEIRQLMKSNFKGSAWQCLMQEEAKIKCVIDENITNEEFIQTLIEFKKQECLSSGISELEIQNLINQTLSHIEAHKAFDQSKEQVSPFEPFIQCSQIQETSNQEQQKIQANQQILNNTKMWDTEMSLESPYAQNGNATFDLLNESDSLEMNVKQGIPMSDVVYKQESNMFQI